jgi:uncharacterized repeat protein (TIGR01451 family)
MKTFFTKITKNISLRSASLITSIALVVVAIPAAVLAYGPERPTFTRENPAPYVTFNSITNEANYGDERNFFRVRDVAAGTPYGDEINLVAGKEYEALIYYHNNAHPSLNASGQGIAQNAYAKAEMPAVIKKGQSAVGANAYVGATNANPAQVYDYIRFTNQTAGDIALRYVAGTTKIFNNGATNGQSLGDTALFSANGAALGYDSLDGTVPGCSEYAGYITYRFVAAQPNFSFAKDVRLNGTKAWANDLSAAKGATVDYKLSYTNTGTTQQDNVVLRDILPAGLTYVPGSSKLFNVNHPEGKQMTDGIGAGGINIGNYTKGSNAFFTFSARVDGAPCAVLTNTASAETDNGNAQDTANVTLTGNCTAAPALPTTGPVEVIAGFIGVAAITIGIVYYIKSRRDLENTLLHAQTNPTTAKKSDEPEVQHTHTSHHKEAKK